MHRLPAHVPVPRHLRHRPPAAEDRHDRLVPLLCHAQLLHARKCQASAETPVKHQPKAFCRLSTEFAHRVGAGDETRTRDIDLGKVALYQLSYSRSARRILASLFRSSWHIGQMTTISSAIRAAVRLIWAASKTSIA